jgi:hypothetical protein
VSFAETPAETDADQIKALVGQVQVQLESISSRLDLYRDALNAQGENVAWLVQNTQGLFQMFASPAFMGQMTELLTKQGISHATGPEDGPDTTGTDGGREGSEILVDS